MEVMVAVMIVSVVIAALFQVRGDASNKLSNIKKMIETNQYNSFLLFTDKYGFDTSRINMQSLVDDFDLESDLRRKLNAIKLNLEYQELQVIDTNEFNSSEQDASTGLIFEIGNSMMKSKEFTSSLLRIKIQ